MIVTGQLCLICVHLVDNQLEARKYRFDALSSQLHKDLILLIISLNGSDFQKIVTIMEFL